MSSIRKDLERQFHNQEYLNVGRTQVVKYHSILGSLKKSYLQVILAGCEGKNVLDYGCGIETELLSLARRGAKVVGLDISDVALRLNQERAREEGLSNSACFVVADGERIPFQADRFDLVCGISILHHLELEKALEEIIRVLRRDGRAVFSEPLGHNPAINLYRRRTPECRTEDEHPLKKQDLQCLERFFQQVRYQFFYLFPLLAVPFRKTRFFQPLLRILEHIDNQVFRWIPFLRLQAWVVLITCAKPIKDR